MERSSAEYPAPGRRGSDTALIEVLKAEKRLSVTALANRLAVTATAVRQRLDRLMRAELVTRSAVVKTGTDGPGGDRRRGRPSHVYSLTDKGWRTGGDNFRDLAMALWSEIRDIREPDVRRGLLGRIGARLAGMVGDRVGGSGPAERLESTARILRERRISCEVATSPEGLPVLTSHACPYPDLAEQDRGICAAEREMLQALVGHRIQLSECRLDGADCCRFAVAEPVRAHAGEAAPCIPSP